MQFARARNVPSDSTDENLASMTGSRAQQSHPLHVEWPRRQAISATLCQVTCRADSAVTRGRLTLCSSLIVFYISGHGFGHASRDIEVLNALGRLAPHEPVAVRTSAPKWLFDLTLTRPVDFSTRECDTGVVQIDSLSLDEAETVRRASAFHDGLTRWRTRRRTGLAQSAHAWSSATSRRWRARPLTRPACLPLRWATSRGTGFTRATASGSRRAPISSRSWAPPMPLPTRRSACRCTAALPRCARSSTCRSSRGAPRAHPLDTRAHLGLPGDHRLALLSFGGYGLQRIDLGAAAGLTGYTIVVTADVTANRRANEVPSDAAARPFRRQRQARRRAGALRGTACGTKTWSRQSTS